MTNVTIEEMRPKLLTIDQIHQRLARTEPLAVRHISAENRIMFKFEETWADALGATDGSDVVDAVMRIDSHDYRLTKDAALQVGANVGIPGALAKKLPSSLLEQDLNYFYSAGLGSVEYNALSVKGNLAAFVKPTLVPFSNLALLEEAVDRIRDHYGENVEILADYKFDHSIQNTDIRLVLPSEQWTLVGGDMADVEPGSTDVWSPGLNISNSLTGKSMTSLEGYWFRWVCTNGLVRQLENVGVWNRRADGQSEEALFEWAGRSIDEIFEGLDGAFASIQALTQLHLGANAGDIVKKIFKDYDTPTAQRTTILQDIIDQPDPTMYSTMNAITRAANKPDLKPGVADHLMRTGGLLPTDTFDTTKAKIWREGHTADDRTPNPYEISIPTS